MTRTLVLGGARSGKSAYAEQLATASGKPVIYIATASAGDAEMATRITHHRARRPASWRTIEEPVALGEALLEHATCGNLVVVDCLTLWLSNVMFPDAATLPDAGPILLAPLFHQQRLRLLQALDAVGGDVLLVSNEVGMGIVPFGAVARCFADEAGRLNQSVAASCERVVLVAAGLPLILKGAPC
jgi:adenosylcobinamide kinase/adenosylcobinamide-phosphate guanylyltransferase